MKKETTQNKQPYHHGDLQVSLVDVAAKMIEQEGIENLSLRKLAQEVGVSRTAAYHHFKDKNDLLCAVAAQGFTAWKKIADQIFSNQEYTLNQQYREFFSQYIKFACNNPSLYDLMFGRIIWKEDKSTPALRDIAYPCFQYQVEMTKIWQEKGLLPMAENTLRLAQVTWGTMHGIARLIIDGIYADTNNIDEMCECAMNLFLSATPK